MIYDSDCENRVDGDQGVVQFVSRCAYLLGKDANTHSDETLAALTQLRGAIETITTGGFSIPMSSEHSFAHVSRLDNIIDAYLHKIISHYLASLVDAYVLTAATIANRLYCNKAYAIPERLLEDLFGGLCHVNIQVARTVLQTLKNLLSGRLTGLWKSDAPFFYRIIWPAIDFFNRPDATNADKSAVVNMMFEYTKYCNSIDWGCIGNPRIFYFWWGSTPKKETPRKLNNFFCEAFAHGLKHNKIDRRWFREIIEVVSNTCMTGAHDTIQLLHLAMVVLRGPEGDDDMGEEAVTVPRKLAAEQLGHVMEFLPTDHLDRLAFVCRDVWTTTVRLHQTLYQRLRLFDKAQLRVPAMRIIHNIVINYYICTADADDDEKLAVFNDAAMLLLGEALSHDAQDDETFLRKPLPHDKIQILHDLTYYRTALLKQQCVSDLLTQCMNADQWEGRQQNAVNFLIWGIRLFDSEDCVLVFNEDSELFKLLASIVAAVQRCPRSRRIEALELVKIEAGKQVPAEAAFFDEIKAAPDAWARAWRHFKEYEEHQKAPQDTLRNAEAAATAGWQYFLRFVIWLYDNHE